MQINKADLRRLTNVPDQFTADEVRKYNEQRQDDSLVLKEADPHNSGVTQIIQSFEDVRSKIKCDPQRRLQEEAKELC